MLSRLGYVADLAVNGLCAVEAIEKTAYDVVLMDIQMPEMNGIEAARMVREKLGMMCPTIFALTAEDLAGDQDRFLSLGFDGYLRKPLQAVMLQGLLKTVKPLAGKGFEIQPEFGLASGRLAPLDVTESAWIS